MNAQPRPRDHTSNLSQPSDPLRQRNVLELLAQREICPRAKHVRKKHLGEAPRIYYARSSVLGGLSPLGDPRQSLFSWVETESLRHLSAKYCPLMPPPRSTIAAAFSFDGKTLASTHGDHTVKIIDFQTGNCMKVLQGHRRTPWVVSFHPLRPNILVSGSLDHEVRLWDARTSECIVSRNFYRPIASISFHAEGELLAIASGHKLYVWYYNRYDEASSPSIILRTRRSLRAVHFHPHGAPLLLTAEVNDLDSSDTSMTLATSLGYAQYPPASVFVANINPKDTLGWTSISDQQFRPLMLPANTTEDSLQHAKSDVAMQMESAATMQMPLHINAAEQYREMMSPMNISPEVHATSYSMSDENASSSHHGPYNPASDAMETSEAQPVIASQPSGTINFLDSDNATTVPDAAFRQTQNHPELVELGHGAMAQRQSREHELPLTQRLLVGQSQSHEASLGSGSNENSAQHGNSTTMTSQSHMSAHSVETGAITNSVQVGINLPGSLGELGFSHQVPLPHLSGHRSGEATAFMSYSHDRSGTQPIISRIQSEFATSLATTTAAELPCTVKLKVWLHDIKHACAPLKAERCRLIIPHAVLCSEMGAHFSPCGRFLVACVACLLPNMEGDAGLQTSAHQQTGAATSPTRHPISAHQVIYELRIYSLEEENFGSVLRSRAIRAAHCLTSIQFSPTSEHVLLAYGRRHNSLLRTIIIDGETTSPIYTVLEIYRVSDMELVSVLPSAEDEVNIACFHPYAGEGLVYGTKEGRLRILQYDKAHGLDCTEPGFFHDENVAEVHTYALEG